MTKETSSNTNKKVLVVTHGLEGINVFNLLSSAVAKIAEVEQKAIMSRINDDFDISIVSNIIIDKERFNSLFERQANFSSEGDKSIWTWTHDLTGSFYRIESIEVL